MKPIVNILASLGSLAAIFFTVNLYLGVTSGTFAGENGIAMVALQLWGAIGAAVALLFGFIGRVMDRTKPRPARRLSNACIAVGLLCGLLIFAMPFVFG